MLTRYIQAAMRQAAYEILEDGSFYGSIPGFPGLWANEATLEACREELQSALEDWILVGRAGPGGGYGERARGDRQGPGAAEGLLAMKGDHSNGKGEGQG